MSIISKFEQLAGNIILAGFDGLALPSEFKRLLQFDALAGIILFKRNVDSIEQVAELNESARHAAPVNSPPIIAVDQEGGRVVRLREPLTVIPCARRFGELDNAEITHKAGKLVGCELASLGFTLNFAPVCDVDTNPNSPIIGDRAYGSSSEKVIKHSLAFARGLISGGIIPCSKHFPGHGDAALDSHLSLPTVSHDIDRLNNVELRPFAAWAEAELGPIMTAHVMYPAFDEINPATLSSVIIEEQLRGRLGFKGPVLTDDMEMGALALFGGPAGAAVQAVEAGADGLLICKNFSNIEAVIDSLARQASKSSSFAGRLEQSTKRLMTLRRTANCSISYIGSSDHLIAYREVMSNFPGVS